MAPYVINVSPSSGSIGVAKNQAIRFTVGDLVGLSLDTVVVTVDGRVAYADSKFAGPWAPLSSVVELVAGLEYSFELVPSREVYYRDGDKITVSVYAEDTLANSTSELWWFYATSGVRGIRIYNMLLDSIRRGDN